MEFSLINLQDVIEFHSIQTSRGISKLIGNAKELRNATSNQTSFPTKHH